MIQPELAAAFSLWLTEPRALSRREDRLHFVVTGATETPLPLELYPTRLFEVGTGSLTVAPDPGDLVRSAQTYMRALAVLPINADAEALVDRLVEDRVVGTARKRVLRRR